MPSAGVASIGTWESSGLVLGTLGEHRLRAGRTKESYRAQAKSSLMSAISEAKVHETGWHLNE